MASEASAPSEADMASPSSGFHHLDLHHKDWCKRQPRLGLWLEADGNGTCAECGRAIDAEGAWASVRLAISLCQTCAGQHRALGRHLSAVKSLSLDAWTPEEVDRLMEGGNRRLQRALRERREGISLPWPAELSAPELMALYTSPEAFLYREQLDWKLAWGSGSRGAPGSEELLEGSSAGAAPSGGAVPACQTPAALAAAAQSAAAKARATVEARADALARRPGYFRTETGLGFAGSGTAGRALVSTVQRSVPGFWAVASALRRCLEPREELPDLKFVVAGLRSQPAASSIFQFAERGDAAQIEALVSTGRASVHDVDELGWTPLFYAAKFGRSEACGLLLRLAPRAAELANTRESGGMGHTPLFYAAEMGCTGCAYLLLCAGAAPDGLGVGQPRRTPLRAAIFNGHKEVVQVLLGFGADPRLLPSDGGYSLSDSYDNFSSEYVATCAARFAWLRRRALFLLRYKAEPRAGPERALVQLLQRPTVFASVLTCI